MFVNKLSRPFATGAAAGLQSARMITFVKCPNCSHAGVASALPRVLVCSQCGQSALLTEGEPLRSPICVREEKYAAREAWKWERSGEAGDEPEARPLSQHPLRFQARLRSTRART